MLTVSLQNLQQENDMLLMIKIIQTMVMEMKIIQPLGLRLKSLNQTFVIIQTHVFLFLFEILKCPEFEVKSKIGKLFMNEKILEEYSDRIYEIDPFFMNITKKK